MDRNFLRLSGLFALALGTALVLFAPKPVLANAFEDGVAAYAAGRYQEAADIWMPLAEAEDPYAQHALGKLYEAGGPGFPANATAAAHWYKAAADQGLAAAQNNLALLYSNGRGVPQDRAKAIDLWRMAAEQGHLHAQYNLALAYYLGEGVELNDRQAAYWFARAADGGLPDAQFAVGQMHRMGIGLVKNEAVALGWYEKAAAQGHTEAGLKAAELRAVGVQAMAPLALPDPGGEIGGTASTEPSVAPIEPEPDVETAEAIPPTPPSGEATALAAVEAVEEEVPALEDTETQLPVPTIEQSAENTAIAGEETSDIPMPPAPIAPAAPSLEAKALPATLDEVETTASAEAPMPAENTDADVGLVEQGDGENPLPEDAVVAAGTEELAPELTAEVVARTDVETPAIPPVPPQQAAIPALPESSEAEVSEPAVEPMIEEVATDLPPSPPSGRSIALPEPSSILPASMTVTETAAPAAPEGVAGLEPVVPAGQTVVVATPATASALQVAASGDSVMWFGSASKAAEAESIAADLKARFPDLLGAITPAIEQANVGGKTVYRITVGPFAGREAARAACDALKARDAQLFCKAAASG